MPEVPIPLKKKVSNYFRFPEVALLRTYKTHPVTMPYRPCPSSLALASGPTEDPSFHSFQCLRGSCSVFLKLKLPKIPERLWGLWAGRDKSHLCCFATFFQKHNSLNKTSCLSSIFSFFPFILDTWSHPNSSHTATLLSGVSISPSSGHPWPTMRALFFWLSSNYSTSPRRSPLLPQKRRATELRDQHSLKLRSIYFQTAFRLRMISLLPPRKYVDLSLIYSFVNKGLSYTFAQRNSICWREYWTSLAWKTWNM